jgi:hypothetical protein
MASEAPPTGASIFCPATCETKIPGDSPQHYGYNAVMAYYRLVRDRSAVQVFVDGIPKVTVDANQRNELRNYMVSAGLTPDEVNHKVHELYITNTTEFTAGH